MIPKVSSLRRLSSLFHKTVGPERKKKSEPTTSHSRSMPCFSRVNSSPLSSNHQNNYQIMTDSAIPNNSTPLHITESLSSNTNLQDKNPDESSVIFIHRYVRESCQIFSADEHLR